MAQQESERLAALRALGVLDSPSNPRLDLLVRQAANCLRAPVALVSLVDSDRQWFKAGVGIDLKETPRDWSFCSLAIEGEAESVFIVEDATLDPRFADNPLVTGDLGVRFYCGAVLTDLNGANLGALCTIDTQPRSRPTEADLEKLRLMARLVVAELEIQKREQILEERTAVVEMTEAISGVATWKYDVQRQQFFGSPLAYAIHGIDPLKYPGDIATTIGLYAKADRATVEKLVSMALATGLGYEIQTRITRPDGATRDVLLKAECRKNARGDVSALVGVFQDITEQVANARVMEEAKRQSERLNWALEAFAKSAAALKGFEDPVALFAGICQTIVEGDRYPLAVVCLAQDDEEKTMPVVAAAGRAITYAENLELSWDETKPTGGGPAARTVRSGKTTVARDIAKEPSFFPWREAALSHGLHSSASIRFDAPGYKAGLLTVYADVAGSFNPSELEVFLKLSTELSYALYLERSRRELQESQRAISEALERANAANEAKSTFLANMSHELRTPLNGILGVAGALRLSTLAPRQRDMVALIEDSARSLNLILADILDWSRAEAGKLILHTGLFSPLHSLKPAIDLMAVRAEEKGLDYVVEFVGEVEGAFEGDALRINQILSNLLSNAIKFTHVGRVTVQVEVVAGTDLERTLAISVADTGSGFDAAEQARLFDRFEQLDSSVTRRYGGTGLGLSIVAALVELMGGVIDVQSRPQFGSRFDVRLPLTPAVSPAVVPASEDPLLLPEGLRVLLAEDHPTNQKVVEMVLAPYGVDLTIVENGRQAVDRWQSGGFDLILMDMQMPVMDGLAAVRHIRAQEAERGGIYTPIAILTANVGKDYLAQSLEAGADGYIAKPVEPKSLIAGICRTLETVIAKFEAA